MINNAYDFCVNRLLEECSQQGWNLSISDGGGYKLTPSINRKHQTAFIPKYMEGLLVLDELEANEDFVSFLLAIHMLINNEYGYCDELIGSLFKRLNGLKPKDSLYKKIKAKLLFVVLHELGHYAYEENEEIRSFLKGHAEEWLQHLESIYQLREEDLDRFVGLVKQETSDLLEFEGVLKQLFSQSLHESARNVLSKEQKIEEIAADMFSLLEMESMLSTNSDSKGNSYDESMVMGVFEAIYFVGSIISLNSTLDLGFTQEKTIVRNTELIAFNSIRIGGASHLLETLFETDIDLLDHPDIFRSSLRCILLLSEDRFEKYVEITANGSNSQKDTLKFNDCYGRLLLYIDELRGLYA